MDPGTIYSDDEINNYSSDDSDDNEIENSNENQDYVDRSKFFDSLDDDGITNTFAEVNLDYVKRYLNKNTGYDIQETIDRVRMKMEESLESQINMMHDECENSEFIHKVKDEIKFREKDAKIKEVKRSRKKERDIKKSEELKLSFEMAQPAPPGSTFNDMNLFPPLLKAIAYMGFTEPTPIQATTIPVALRGRDICGCAATGTGKTAAFMLPILQRLLLKNTDETVTRVLVLVPTRELAVQVFQMSEQLAKFCNIKITLLAGGLKSSIQAGELKEFPDIIVASPGRLLDHMANTPGFALSEVEVLVIDEADRMLDEHFIQQLNDIVACCCPVRQTLLFSATMTEEVKSLAAVSLKNPVRVFVNNNTDVAENLRLEYVRMNSAENCRMATLAYLLSNHFKDSCLVFTPTKDECHELRIVFGILGFKCGELHSRLKQNQRLENLQKFRDKRTRVLFATDVAARGLDMKGVKTVINYTLPNTYEMYVHRVGRTARAGSSGLSLSLISGSGKDYVKLKEIRRKSLYPVYERLIHNSRVQPFLSIIKEVNSFIEEVKELESKERKAYSEMLQRKEAEQARLESRKRKFEERMAKLNKKPKKPKKKANSVNLPETLEEKKDILQAIVRGQPIKLNKVKVAAKHQVVKVNRRRSKKRSKIGDTLDENTQANDNTSIFGNEILLTNKKAKLFTGIPDNLLKKKIKNNKMDTNKKPKVS